MQFYACNLTYGVWGCEGREDDEVLPPAHAAGQVTADVDPELRRRVRAHHTATHLLQSALKKVLGPDTCQQGSQLDAEHLR